MYKYITELWAEGHLPFTTEPRLIKRFTRGLSNNSYLVEADGQYHVARLGRGDSPRPGVVAEREQLILTLLRDTGIAPAVIHHAPEQELLITEYIAGRHWGDQDGNDDALVAQLLQQVQRMQAISPDLDTFDYVGHSQTYLQQLEDTGHKPDDKIRQRHERIMQGLGDLHYTPALCHHDLIPDNILIGRDKLYLLDWEYAAPGWPLFDYACLSMECGVPLPTIPTAELELATELCTHVTELWHLLYDTSRTRAG